jgi:hypothetical protein
MPSYESGQYNLGYVDPSDVESKNLNQMMDWFYQSMYPSNAAAWLQGAIDMNFKVGMQQLYNTAFGNNNFSGETQKFFLNLIRRQINMICGYQRKNRKSTVAMPIHENDDSLSDDWNRVFRYCEDRDGFQEYNSLAFEGAVSTGMNLLELYLDYTNDPISGDLFTDNVSYNNFLIDQYWRKMDFSDCNGIWRRRWTSKNGAKMLLPGYAKEIDRMKPGGMKDGRFPVQAELQNVATSNLFTYDEFYYRTTRPGKIILDPHTGESAEWEEDEGEEKDMMEQVLRQQPWLVVKDVQLPTVKMVLKLGDHVVYHGKNKLGIDQYPFTPAVTYYEPDLANYSMRNQGIIRGLRDPQFLFNMRKMIELKILQSSINAGWIFPVDAVTDMKAFRQNDGGSGFLIPLKAGRLPNEIQRIEPVAIPQTLIELSNSLAEDISKISGVNEELLGSATDDKAGILSMLRQGAGLTTLQTIFDKLDYTQRLYGNIRMAAIRKNFSKGKIRNILGHDPDPRFFTASAQKFSLAVEEGNYSTTQRQMELQQLLHFRELGIPVTDKSILRAAFLTNKKQIIEDMEEQTQQQMQAQQAQSELEAQKTNADVMSKFASSKLNMAKVAETMAKMDQEEASAEHQRASADLELVKTMIELEGMDLETVRQSFELAMAIKSGNSQNEVKEKAVTTAGV